MSAHLGVQPAPEAWDREHDVVVLGTGATGLTAAVVAHEHGAQVGVYEKHEHVGGTAAWSGGQVWIPNNPHMAAVGATDSRDDALRYIMSMSNGLMRTELVEALVDAGPEMVRFLEERTPVQFYAVEGMPDYHAEMPGGKPGGGRTLECPLFPYRDLGAWEHRVTPSPFYTAGNITMSETPLGAPSPKPPSEEELARRAIRNERGCGQALIGRLLKGCLDRDIEPVVSARATALLTSGDRVAGVAFETPDGPLTVRARRGVVLATGGFEWDRSLTETFLRGPMTHPVSIETNTGDGLRLALAAGADLGNMREAWWMPAAEVPNTENHLGRQMISSHRTLPHSIMVNGGGRRFTNEGANYNAFGAAFHEIDVSTCTYRNIPAWLVFDENYVEKFGFAGRFGVPGQVADWVQRADTATQLAEDLGMPAGAFEATLDRWNAHVDAGRDPDFGRGQHAHDRWWGDPHKKGTTDGTLGRLDRGPFYAVPVHPGSIGTKGGPRTDADGRIVDTQGHPIAGLFGAGNVIASPMAMTYGGPGGTLGPAMTFAYLAGRAAAVQA